MSTYKQAGTATLGLTLALGMTVGVSDAQAALSVVRNDVTWDATFEGGNQPHFDEGPGPIENPAWIFGGAAGSASSGSDGDIYTHNSTDGGYYYFEQTDSTWTSAGTQRTIEFRVRSTSQDTPGAGGETVRVTIGMDDDYWDFSIKDVGVQLANFVPLGSVTPLDGTEFHTYRIVLDSTLATDKVKVYIDGSTTPAITSGGTAPGNIAAFDLIRLGDASGGGIGGSSEWDFFSWTSGAHAPVASSLTGDLNGDGFVGIADLNIVLGAWNQNVPPGDPLADPTGDGFVGIADLNVVLGNWNAGTPPAAGAPSIPEPATLGLFSLGGLALVKRQRRSFAR